MVILQTGCTVVTGRPDGGEESQSGDDSIKIYLHCVSNSKAALLVGTCESFILISNTNG